MNQEQLEDHINKSWKFYKETLNSAKYILAPMVDQSELAFRLLSRKYGSELCYSPMLHSRVILENKKYKDIYLQNRKDYKKQDSPFIVQFCGNDSETLIQAGKLVENDCDAIDLNLGCPQGIARKGHYGSYLLNEPELIYNLVFNMHKQLKVPITCKIRVLDDLEKTLKLCEGLQQHGCSILTVHGRTKEQKKDQTGKCDWQIIKTIKQKLRIPVFANGGIYHFQDVQKCLEFTKADGVMSSEGALENIGIFQEEIVDLDEIAKEYIDLAEKTQENPGWVKAHLFKILHKGLQQNIDLRSKLGQSRTFTEFKQIQIELQNRRIGQDKQSKFGWYWRHLSYNNNNNQLNNQLNSENINLKEDTIQNNNQINNDLITKEINLQNSFKINQQLENILIQQQLLNDNLDKKIKI